MACTLKFTNNLFLSNVSIKHKIFPQLGICSRQYCSKDNESDPPEKNLSEEKQEKNTKELPEMFKIKKDAKSPSKDSQETAKKKLMSLLSEIKISSDIPARTQSNLNLARPLKRISKAERFEKMKAEEITPEKQLHSAVKAVASSFKDDPEKIESELTQKLKSLKLAKEAVVEESADIDSSKFDNKMNENLMSSVEKVATTISESPIPPRSELTKRLLRMSLERETSPEKKVSMKSAIEKMKFQPSSLPSNRWERDERRRPEIKPQELSKIDLFGSTPLNIFKLDSDTKTDSRNEFWQKLQEKQLRLLTQFAPANGFEEMILWTEQGKHWKFPIDNEDGMEAEKKVGFHEHIFLEQHLKGFPERGPVRHFMELVTVGLSKNPYITVERKLENIEWFRNYFKEKEDILKETGALD